MHLIKKFKKILFHFFHIVATKIGGANYACVSYWFENMIIQKDVNLFSLYKFQKFSRYNKLGICMHTVESLQFCSLWIVNLAWLEYNYFLYIYFIFSSFFGILFHVYKKLNLHKIDFWCEKSVILLNRYDLDGLLFFFIFEYIGYKWHLSYWHL